MPGTAKSEPNAAGGDDADETPPAAGEGAETGVVASGGRNSHGSWRIAAAVAAAAAADGDSVSEGRMLMMAA